MVIIFTSSYFLGILWHIYVCDVQVTEYYNMEDKHGGGVHEANFMTHKLNKDDPENTDKEIDYMIKVLYFALTTLSTIGYGDFHPVSK